jgi:hypothetical protein
MVPDGCRWLVKTEVSKLKLCHIDILGSGRFDDVCVEINGKLCAVVNLIHGSNSDSDTEITSYQ